MILTREVPTNQEFFKMSAKMRAKFQIQTVTLNGYSEQIKFSAVCGGSAEDNSFSAATPSATCEMTISNKALHGQFKPGEKFYVDFTPTDT